MRRPRAEPGAPHAVLAGLLSDSDTEFSRQLVPPKGGFDPAATSITAGRLHQGGGSGVGSGSSLSGCACSAAVRTRGLGRMGRHLALVQVLQEHISCLPAMLPENVAGVVVDQ